MIAKERTITMKYMYCTIDSKIVNRVRKFEQKIGKKVRTSYNKMLKTKRELENFQRKIHIFSCSLYFSAKCGIYNIVYLQCLSAAFSGLCQRTDSRKFISGILLSEPPAVYIIQYWKHMSMQNFFLYFFSPGKDEPCCLFCQKKIKKNAKK